MDEGGFLSEKRITIAGLGLMGGSLAWALRGHCHAIYGVDTDPDTVQMAIERKIIDSGSKSLADLLPQTDLLVLAAPVRANLKMLLELPSLQSDAMAVMDLSSTKMEIVEAMDSLPGCFSTIGGHPMCGKESSGLANAEKSLFTGANFFLTGTQQTSHELKNMAEELAKVVGSNPLWVDAETHDRCTAASSHGPYLLSAVLAGTTPMDAAPFISTGFQSVSRLAGSDVTMMMDVLLTNREQVLMTLAAYRDAFDEIESALQESPDALRARLESARDRHKRLLLPKA